MVTYFTSNEIDNEIYGVPTESNEIKKESKEDKEAKESGALALKIVVIIGFIFVMAKLFQWVISTS